MGVQSVVRLCADSIVVCLWCAVGCRAVRLVFCWCWWLSKGAVVHPLMLLSVDAYAGGVVGGSFALVGFMGVLVGVCLPCGFGCWRG